MKLHKLFPLLVASLTICGLSLAVKNNESAQMVEAKEEISLSSPGDSFALLDKEYAKTESFVYTGDINFRSGQAGGLVFGAQENDHYFVMNMDRFENSVKLIYFKSNGSGGYNADEIRADYFIGNDKITLSERNVVDPMVREIGSVNIKIVITIDGAHAYADFFVEGIKRFGPYSTSSPIDLNAVRSGLTYEGGHIGLNCFNSDVLLNKIEYGTSDYSYFSEPYRNQYHLQPFAKWSNDPNALCYHNGYYHVFYQTYPFGQQWGPMFWGHARSVDLIHFEFLPICLFPDDGGMGVGDGVGYMWSGCAMSYKQGTSSLVDSKNWFSTGGGDGMLAIFTRDGAMQDQVIISSDDNGLTWTKRIKISQFDITGNPNKVDCRDPKIFPVKDNLGNFVKWGMTLSGYISNTGWFLKSDDLINWSPAGSYTLPTPECIGAGYIKDQKNNEYAYLTNKSRTYLLGQFSYNDMTGNIVFKDETNTDISTYNLETMTAKLKTLDFGPDTYASQSFYINDVASEFNGKEIVLNWFSGDLNAPFCTGPGEYAELRSRWNGGFTTPVEYGVLDTGTEKRITQKPITVNNTNLLKTNVVNIQNQAINSESENPLKDVATHIFELESSITVNDNSPIVFKVDVGRDEYMEFGWNSTDGYYVDRTNLDDKDINTNVDWHTRYSSHILGTSNTKTFYVLSDNGGLEVFCENYSVPFYFVTTAAPSSVGASLEATNATINTLKLNNIKSAYRDESVPGEGILYVTTNEVNLDTKLKVSKYVTCWYSGVGSLVWETLNNEGVVEATTSNSGINLTALKQGNASFKVSINGQEETIDVHVYTGYFESSFHFSKENIITGEWFMSADTIVGEKTGGNGFMFSEETGDDFTYTGKFDIEYGAAAALVFRAASDMSRYIVANYDTGEHIVKLWSRYSGGTRELARSSYIDVSLKDIVLSIKASGRKVDITINGIEAIHTELPSDEPASGRFGLNVFKAKAVFKSLSLIRENYEYVSGELVIPMEIDQYITGVYNLTLGNTKLEPGFYRQGAKTLSITQEYFDLIENGTYRFKIVGTSYTLYINVTVNMTSHQLIISDVTTELGVDVSVYVGVNAVTSLKVNGEVVDASKYHVENYVLTISHECFKEGENEVVVNDDVTFTVTVKDLKTAQKTKNNTNTIILIVAIAGGGVLLIGGGLALTLVLINRKKKVKK